MVTVAVSSYMHERHGTKAFFEIGRNFRYFFLLEPQAVMEYWVYRLVPQGKICTTTGRFTWTHQRQKQTRKNYKSCECGLKFASLSLELSFALGILRDCSFKHLWGLHIPAKKKNCIVTRWSFLNETIQLHLYKSIKCESSLMIRFHTGLNTARLGLHDTCTLLV